MNNSQSAATLKRIVKLVIFFAIIFSLIFCITWQNVHMGLLNKEIEGLAKKRNALEKNIYLMNIEFSYLKSRERIKKIAQEELNMVPVTYRDINLIVY